jgi:hypothetical protein
MKGTWASGRVMLTCRADWYSSRHDLHSQSGTVAVSLRASRHASCARGVFLSCRMEGT